jgi:phosphoadenosine phosphosulfate reductase
LSPPGDPYPAMDGHLERAKRTIDRQFGAGIGAELLPSTKTVVMNKVSSLDAMYEIIIDGHIIGRLRFDIPRCDYVFVLSLEGGRRIGLMSQRNWLTCQDGVLEYLKKGSNLLVPGIADCDTGIGLGDEVWIRDLQGQVIGVGVARMTGSEIKESKTGYAVKMREVADPKNASVNDRDASWDNAVEANASDLRSIEAEAVDFIRRTAEEQNLRIVVGFSGGKDSLATYLLSEKALNKSPLVFFTDTGLELPETVSYVKDFAQSRGVRIIGHSAGDQFWDSVQVFGPPARDFRWCCKVLKLGPAAKSIAEDLGGNALVLMGQRKLESFQRSVEPRIALNPWVPGQVSASPIHNWNALEVWLYIFREKAKFNPLYNRGFLRMGCYLCPATPLAELESLAETHPLLYERWRRTLQEWAKKYGFPEEWARLGFWRWKKLPSGQMNVVNEMGLKIKADREAPSETLELQIVKGISPCTSSGFSLEGQFSAGVNLERLSKVLSIFGPTHYTEDLGALRAVTDDTSITLFSSGSLVIRGRNQEKVGRVANQLERAVRRAMFCQGCGSCVPQCNRAALGLQEGKIAVDGEKCIHCMECDSWPCPTYLG